MSLLAPFFLALGAIAIPIIIMYMMKLRRREVEISSTLLWQMVLRDRQANAPWQRLRRNLFLLLQLLILALAVFALARPAVPVSVVAKGPLIVLLDGSASMRAVDLEPTRFEAAKDEVSEIINGLNSDSPMTIILAGNEPQILVSAETDRAVLLEALTRGETSAGAVDWEAAFALAAGAMNIGGSTEATLVIVSDGGVPVETLPPVPGKVKYVSIGNSGDNLAVSALSVRPVLAGTGEVANTSAELFARITNYSAGDRTLVLSIFDNDINISSEIIEIPGGGSTSFVLSNLSDSSGIFEARLENVEAGRPLDDFPADDVAFAVLQPTNQGRTLLVSDGNLFLEQLLGALQDITPFRAVPNADGSFTIPDDPFDLYIFDGTIPNEIPEGNLLILNPPPNEFFNVRGITENPENPFVADHPLTDFVDWTNIHVARTRTVDLPAWGEILVGSDSTPLIFSGQTNGRRLAVVAFDLQDSDLPIQITYPILFSGLIDFLTPSSGFDAVNGLDPGASLAIRPEAGVEIVRIQAPNGEIYEPPITENGVLFTETKETGVYSVQYTESGAQRSEYFAVNLFAPEESAILPEANLIVGSAAVLPAANEEIGQREFWPWLAFAGLMILLIEWWVYHRRELIPALRT